MLTPKADFVWLCMPTPQPGQGGSVPQVLCMDTERVWMNGICLDLPIVKWKRNECPPLFRERVCLKLGIDRSLDWLHVPGYTVGGRDDIS